MKVLLFFIDGLGISENKEGNPFCIASIPIIDSLLKGLKGELIITDACLGIEGLPQSATGQTTILTGVNAASIMGRHISGFPGPTLKKILAKDNIFIKLKKLDKKVTFANAYTEDYVHKLRLGKVKGSVTSISLLSSRTAFRYITQIVKGEAVYQDFTNKILQEQGYSIPLYTPEEAADKLIKIVEENDFTLYEYFQTDRTGHKQDMSIAINILNNLDVFIGRLLQGLNLNDTLLLITSDHGNIENLSVKTHTRNPVPTILIGKGSKSIKNKINSITDTTPAVLSLFT